MASRLKLEVFDTADFRFDPDEAGVSASVLEEARLAAYESGYSAGWEDAVTSQGTDQVRVQADVARNLQALSFTYHEARGHILRCLEPLLRDMVDKILPDMARSALGPMVLDALRPAAVRMAATPVTITVHPDSRAVVESMLAADGTVPFRIVEEPSLSEGQVFLRFDDTEQRIDLDGVIAAIAAAVASFFHIEQQEKVHG